MRTRLLERTAVAMIRLLLRLYPAQFRARFGGAMVDDFRERLAERASGGTAGLLVLVGRTAADLVVTAMRERLSRSARGYGSTRRGVIDDLAVDLRFAFRTLRKRPGFTAVAILIFGLGIGANTAIFSAVNAVLLRPIPVSDPDRLVMVWEENREEGWAREVAAPANFYDWREQVSAFRDAAGYGTGQATLAGDGLPEVLSGSWVTGNFFAVLGVRAAHGRTFREEETWGDAERVVVLSDAFWARRFGRDPAIVGASITIDEVPREVVGILPAGVEFPERGVDLWMPLGWDRSAPQRSWFRSEHFLRVVARLEAGASLEQADEQLQVVVQRLREEYPETNGELGAGITPLQEFLVADARAPLLILLGSTGLLLVLTCANVANLLLVRALGRDREVALRRALGAGGGRIVRQLLTESVALALAGGVVGLSAGLLGVRAMVALQPPGAWRLDDVPIDARVLLFALVISIASGVLFGMAPALRGKSASATTALMQGTRATSGKRSRRASQLMVVAEIGLAVVLVTGAGLLLRSFVALRQVDPGFRIESRAGAAVVLPPRYDSDAKILTFVDELVPRLERLRGVESVTYMSRLPLTGSTAGLRDFTIEGDAGDYTAVYFSGRAVAPNYFMAMGVPVLRGRAFAESDRAGSEPVVVINREMSRKYFANEDPIGRRIAFERNAGAAARWYRIVGMVGDEHQNGVGSPPQAEYFIPFRQIPSVRVRLVVHARGELSGLAEMMRAEVAAVDPMLPLSEYQTLEQMYAGSLGRDRFLFTLVSAFAGLALLLATVGVYGVTAESARRRTHEIGIRVALGARAGDVARMILGHGLSLAGAGILLGLLGALAGVRLLATVLYGVAPHDATTFVTVPIVLALAAGAACAIPALRAARVDPVVALGQD
jgi:putative ABC transport system permease protein